MRSERGKMLAGELYDPLDHDLVARRTRARDLCHGLNATREGDADHRRRILRDLLGTGGETVRMEPPFFCDYGENIHLGEYVYFNFNCVVLSLGTFPPAYSPSATHVASFARSRSDPA